jgi:uncharacterized protein (TIGR03083 family)
MAGPDPPPRARPAQPAPCRHGNVPLVASGLIVDAFCAEGERLSEVVSGQDEAAFARSSPCPPWTVGELLYHLRTAVGRVPSMLAEAEPADGPLVSAAGYYRPDQRFSPATNSERISAAQQGAAALSPGTAMARDFEQAWRQAWAQSLAAPQERIVRTRHGDRMLLTEFLRTRILELAVHGLDVAAGLGRGPWMTTAAARVVEGLLLPARSGSGSGSGSEPEWGSLPGSEILLAETGWDRITLIAKATRRMPITAAEATLIERQGIQWLALG